MGLEVLRHRTQLLRDFQLICPERATISPPKLSATVSENKTSASCLAGSGPNKRTRFYFCLAALFI
jgi:hypothetical protein